MNFVINALYLFCYYAEIKSIDIIEVNLNELRNYNNEYF